MIRTWQCGFVKILLIRIKNTFDKYCKAGRCGSISKVLNELVENGNNAARELNLGEFVGQPDIVRVLRAP
jgi:hypothetical protein